MKTNSFTTQVEKKYLQNKKDEINSWIYVLHIMKCTTKVGNNRINFRKKYKILDYEDYSIILIKKKYFSGYAFTPLDI
jgi:hypothetical protein